MKHSGHPGKWSWVYSNVPSPSHHALPVRSPAWALVVIFISKIFSIWSNHMLCKLLKTRTGQELIKILKSPWSTSGGGVTHLRHSQFVLPRLPSASYIIQTEASAGTKSFGNLQRLLISIFLNGETFTSSVHPALPDRLICICLSVSYPASDCLHKTTMGLRQITACMRGLYWWGSRPVCHSFPGCFKVKIIEELKLNY